MGVVIGLAVVVGAIVLGAVANEVENYFRGNYTEENRFLKRK